MRTTLFAFVAAIAALHPAWAQNRIYRCGNEYTNNATQAKERCCKLVEGGNVTVLSSTPPSGGSASSPPNAPRVSPATQSARDADARAILEAELRKAETKLADLKKEYNDGAPERNALDLRNPQAYAERTDELKTSVSRAEADVNAIRRELDRMK